MSMSTPSHVCSIRESGMTMTLRASLLVQTLLTLVFANGHDVILALPRSILCTDAFLEGVAFVHVAGTAEGCYCALRLALRRRLAQPCQDITRTAQHVHRRRLVPAV